MLYNINTIRCYVVVESHTPAPERYKDVVGTNLLTFSHLSMYTQIYKNTLLLASLDHTFDLDTSPKSLVELYIFFKGSWLVIYHKARRGDFIFLTLSLIKPELYLLCSGIIC